MLSQHKLFQAVSIGVAQIWKLADTLISNADTDRRSNVQILYFSSLATFSTFQCYNYTFVTLLIRVVMADIRVRESWERSILYYLWVMASTIPLQ